MEPVFGSESAAAGQGGAGVFTGSLVHASFAIYRPINIAIAGQNAEAHAEQTNDVVIDQHGFQLAGIGGHGGSGNLALDDAHASALLHLIGSDAVAFGGGAGNGGAGVFTGALADIDVAVFAPINIAVAGYHATAEAHQTNAVAFDQATVQIAGVGGDGGDHNLAGAQDLVLDLLEAYHLVT